MAIEQYQCSSRQDESRISIPGRKLTAKHKPRSTKDRIKFRRITIRIHKRRQRHVPRPTFREIDARRKDDERHEHEKGEGHECVFGAVNGDVHDFDGATRVTRLAKISHRHLKRNGDSQKNLILITKCSKHPQETQRS